MNCLVIFMKCVYSIVIILEPTQCPETLFYQDLIILHGGAMHMVVLQIHVVQTYNATVTEFYRPTLYICKTHAYSIAYGIIVLL